MIIENTIKMTLEDEEISALKTLKDAHIQCLISEKWDCDICPLLTREDVCIGVYADMIINDRGLNYDN